MKWKRMTASSSPFPPYFPQAPAPPPPGLPSALAAPVRIPHAAPAPRRRKRPGLPRRNAPIPAHRHIRVVGLALPGPLGFRYRGSLLTLAPRCCGSCCRGSRRRSPLLPPPSAPARLSSFCVCQGDGSSDNIQFA